MSTTARSNGRRRKPSAAAPADDGQHPGSHHGDRSLVEECQGDVQPGRIDLHVGIDERHQWPPPHDEVDVVMPKGEAMGFQAPATVLQPFGRDDLALPTITVARVGPLLDRNAGGRHGGHDGRRCCRHGDPVNATRPPRARDAQASRVGGCSEVTTGRSWIDRRSPFTRAPLAGRRPRTPGRACAA